MSSAGFEQNRREEKRRGGGREEEDGGASVQRMLYVSVSAVDGCCSVLARQKLGEKEEEKTEQKEQTEQKTGNQK